MIRKWIVLFSMIFSIVGAKEKTICLNMIVKDEKEVIERCLNSVKDQIDYWVIVDTGSKDGTQEIIKKTLKDIPGKLYERPWVDFGHNRTEALVLAKGKGDYLLFIDADEQLTGKINKLKLEKDLYIVTLHSKDMASKRALLVNSHVPGLKYVGVLHEYLAGVTDKDGVLLDEVSILNPQDGHRSKDAAKYAKDAKVLEEAIKRDPGNSRYVFYLAQSYSNCDELKLALKNYEKRVAMDTEHSDEIYWSLLRIGEIQEKLKYPPEDVIDSYSRCFQYLPTQAEPLLRLASYFTGRQNYILGYFIAKIGLAVPRSREIVFTLPWIYDYGFQTVVAECCFRMGKNDEACQYLQSALNNPLPSDIREQITVNLNVIRAQMEVAPLQNL